MRRKAIITRECCKILTVTAEPPTLYNNPTLSERLSYQSHFQPGTRLCSGGKGKTKSASEANIAIVWGGERVTPPLSSTRLASLAYFSDSPPFFFLFPLLRNLVPRQSHFASVIL